MPHRLPAARPVRKRGRGDETVTIGAPYVEGATVEATVEKQGKERKVTIYKYNAKKHYHKKQGHRQPYTKLIVDSINVK